MAPWADWEMGGASSHMASLEKVIALTGNTSTLSSHTTIPPPILQACWWLSVFFPGRRLAVASILTEVVHALFALPRALRSDVRLVNAHHVTCLLAGLWLGRLLDIPVLLTVHDYYTFGDVHAGFLKANSPDARFALAVERYAYRHADHILAVDTRIQEYVEREALPVQRRVAKRLNFLDTSEFLPREKAVAREALDRSGLHLDAFLDRGVQLVLCPRRLSPKNGVDVFLRAAKLVASRSDGIHFLIAGEGIQRDELLALRARLGVEDRVTFLGGVVPGIIRYLYNVVDLVVIPSITIQGIQEASSISALEAMSSGVPLICSAIGGLKELVADGETGHLVPENSPDALADAIVRVLEEDESAITSRAREQVLEHTPSKATPTTSSRFSRRTLAWVGNEPRLPRGMRSPKARARLLVRVLACAHSRGEEPVRRASPSLDRPAREAPGRRGAIPALHRHALPARPPRGPGARGACVGTPVGGAPGPDRPVSVSRVRAHRSSPSGRPHPPLGRLRRGPRFTA